MTLLRVGFYKVKTSGEERRSFSEAVNSISQLPISEREQDLGAINKPHNVRLEHLDQDEKYVYGEITRVQVNNIPAEARNDGIVDLDIEGGLAHPTAFRYHKEMGILAIQLTRTGTSLGRLAAYLEKFEDACKYQFEPLARDNVWERYNSNKPRKMCLAISKPENLELIEDEDASILSNAKNMVDMYEGVSINIEISVGRKKSTLNFEKTKRFIENTLKFRESNPGVVQILKISSGTEDRIEDKIDFLEEILVERIEIDDLPNNAERNYKIRRDHIKTIFSTYLPILHKQFGNYND